jgi:hypothetical protein
MKESIQKLMLSALIVFIVQNGFSQSLQYQDGWGDHGITLRDQSLDGVKINYSLSDVYFPEVDMDGEAYTSVKVPGVFLPNETGAPDLPCHSRFIAIPQGSTASVQIKSMRMETLTNQDVAPAPVIPLDTDNGPLKYQKNSEIYSKNAFYPLQPVTLSSPAQLRGLDVVVLSITPFQYNPVTRELQVLRDIEIEIIFTGGNGIFGDERLRSRWWDPIVKDAVLNPDAIPAIDYGKKMGSSKTVGYEYLIIAPNDPIFIAWADSIKNFRTLQGIKTGVVTTTAIGGNTTSAIESYVNNAYNTWDIPPVAVLLLGDHGTTGSTVVSPIYNSYCVSDNIYADVTGNHLPDIVFARMTAQNATHLQTMVTKFLKNERTPPTNPAYYNNPVTACGWQTERWFQICAETVGGFWKNVQGKNPVRINEIYSGTPGTSWSTATNTATVVNYFGPSGLGYIPSSPSTLGGWTGGNATMINNTINNGSFMLMHRDHGGEQGWGEPAYSSTNINGLTNSDLPWIFSINCLTGKYNISGECFTEKFHRYTYNGQNSGALGVTAASEVSYSFVNDTYVWGLMDNMWPDFMPAYGTTPPSRDVLPAFGNAAGKIFLASSSWPYNTTNKQVTYHLFHHHGDAFTTVYSEMPQNLSVNHASAVLSGTNSFMVTANTGALIALTVNGEIIGTATGTGSPLAVPIIPQNPGSTMIVTVTKQNYYRYSANVPVTAPSGPYVTYHSHVINDAAGNNNGIADFGETILLHVGLENVGIEAATNVMAVLSTADPYLTVTDNSHTWGTITAGAILVQTNAFSMTIADNVPDQHLVDFDLEITGDADFTWNSNFSLTVSAPAFTTGNFVVDDATGNGNGRLDPGEAVNIIVEVSNTGNSDSPPATGALSCASPYIAIVTNSFSLGSVPSGSTAYAIFSVQVDPTAPVGTTVTFNFNTVAGNYSSAATNQQVIGQVPVLVLNLDPNNNSAPSMQTAMSDLGVAYDILTSFPLDLNLYSSVFVCLGIYPANTVLSSSQGSILASYLTNGGQIYMEGGDTWYYDPSTPVHNMFNISPVSDGSGDMGSILGIAGTFTQDMSFTYSGENSYMDRIASISPAFLILQNQSPSYGTGVAYNAGVYKTIGTSHEFGGLSNGTFPSTKMELMNQYLTFFGITGTPPIPPIIGLNPLSFEVSLEPDGYQTEVLTLSNTGEETLNFSINVEGVSTAQGKLFQPLTQQQKETMRYQQIVSDVTDELSVDQSFSGNEVLPAISGYPADASKGEETFGSWSGGTWSGGIRDRGNLFYVTESVYLEETRFYLTINSSTQLYFFVYEGDGPTGTFTKKDEVYVASSGTGTGWYSSGAMNVELTSGKYYYIGTSWNGSTTYGRGNETVPITTSFGSLVTGIPGTLAGYPPSLSLNQTYTGFSPYYQTLVTSSTPGTNWLTTGTNSGTVPQMGSENIDVHFDATGLEEGTYYKNLVITSNDPIIPEVILPCTLHVGGDYVVELTAFLEGPFTADQMAASLNLGDHLPLTQPYNTAPWNYTGSESVAVIPNASVVDWVLVEFRDTPGGAATATAATAVETRAAFILTDGSIVDVDGFSPILLNASISDNLFAVIHHRNHIPVMSATAVPKTGNVYHFNFTNSETKVHGGSLGYKEVAPGIWALASGDGLCDGLVDMTDKTAVWNPEAGHSGYHSGDFDLNGQITNLDKTEHWTPNLGKVSQVPE